jgi:hypothetical protein
MTTMMGPFSLLLRRDTKVPAYQLLIPAQAAHHNEMMSPAVTE